MWRHTRRRKRQVRDSTDKALVSDQSADHKCMSETLQFTNVEDKTEMGCSTAVRLKLFSMIERAKHLISAADAK